MKAARFKKWLGIGAEALGSLLLIGGAYLLFMFILDAIFPSGTPLKELIESSTSPSARRPRPEQPAGSLEATLCLLVRDVRFRRGNSVAWGEAAEGMPLFNQDAVQTLDRSGARIAFDANNHLEIGSNSMVLVERVKGDESEGARRYRVRVRGEVQGALTPSKKLKLEVEASGHVARIGKNGAEFRIITISEDSSSFSIYSGEAELVGPGRRLVIPANHGVTVKKGTPATAVYVLPPPPELTDCRSGTYRYRLLPPKLRFGWKGGDGEYRFQLSRWSHFGEPIYDVRTSAPFFMTGELDKGSYFWRVSRIENGREGRYSRPGHLQIIQSLAPPPLFVTFPAEHTAAGSYRIGGTSEPGSRVFIDGKEIPTGNRGEFEHEVVLNPGVNLIRVEALDSAGNATFATRIIYGTSRPEGGEKETSRSGPSAASYQ